MPLLFTGHKRRMDLQCLGVWEHTPHSLVGMASSAELKYTIWLDKIVSRT